MFQISILFLKYLFFKDFAQFSQEIGLVF